MSTKTAQESVKEALNPMQDTLDLADLYLEIGEVRRAERLLTGCEKSLLPEHSHFSCDVTNEVSADRNRRILEVRVQRAVVLLHCGDYDGAVQSLTKELESIGSPALRNKAERWLGFSFILVGDYVAAVKQYRDLLKATQASLSKDEVNTRRDLALAYAYVGAFDKSKESIMAAHMGCITNGIGPEAQQNDRPKAIRDSIYLTEAIIDLICGNYKVGLDHADRAFNGMSRHLGNKHLKTLESAKVRAFLLALNSESLEAEAICRETLRLMRAELGDEHPQTLETMYVLVFIFRTQARLTESIDMGISVCEMMATSLRANHPQTLDARAELAANYRSIGDYNKAAKELIDIVRLSQQQDDFPPQRILRYLSELAHVWCSSRLFGAAEILISTVLRRQRGLFCLSRSWKIRLVRARTIAAEQQEFPNFPTSMGEQMAAMATEVLEEIEFEYDLFKIVDALKANSEDVKDSRALKTNNLILGLRDLLGNRDLLDKYNESILDNICTDIEEGKGKDDTALGSTISNRVRSSFSRLSVHPDLLHTLDIVCTILLANYTKYVVLVEKVLTMMVKWRKRVLGQSHAVTLASEYALAIAQRELSKPSSVELFLNVFEQRLQALGKWHPDTLSAKRELIITKCAFESWESNEFDKDVTEAASADDDTRAITLQGDLPENCDAIEGCSKDILVLLEERLGQHHPETLETLVWVFVVQLDANSHGKQSHALATASEALERLRHEPVQSQRILEATQLEEKIAALFEECGYNDQGTRIRDDLQRRNERSGSFVRETENTARNLLN